ncbi:MAG: PQQ-binding-like beta-propeller repeat protein [Myxococcaceae bacterium]
MRALTAAALLVAGAAWADANITVDGAVTDWASVTSCLADPAGDAQNGVDITKVCVENNNNSGSNGFLFTLYQSAASFPTNVEHYVGFYFDTNNNGVFDTNADDVWALHFPVNATTPDSLQVFTPTTYNLKRSYTSTTNCGGSGSNNGWSGKQSGANIEMAVAYGCLGGGFAFNADYRLMELGVYPNFDLTSNVFYDGTADVLELAAPPNDVANPVAVAGNARNTLVWTNPSLHRGVLVLRGTAVPNTAPVKGTTYTANQTLGNATVIYADDNKSTVSTFADTGRTNGTRYFYKVYNHHQFHTYSAGSAPTSSGLFSEPTAQSGSSPFWCYSVGFPSMQQPTTELGAAVFTASNGGAVTANRTTVGTPSTDGSERWRPVQLSAAVQNRPTLVPLTGVANKVLITGDQAGHGYAIDDGTGQVLWTANGGAALGNAVQGQPVAQLYAYANAAFQTANPNRDLIFFATRNTSATNNKVYAVSGQTGAVVWTYAPNNLDIVSGGMMVDYTNNHLFVAARSNGGAQTSLRVLNSLTGAQLAALNVGDVDFGVNLDFSSNQAYLVNNAGTAYGISLTSLAVVWSSTVGATSSWIYPTGNGFIASLKSGVVRRYGVSGTTVTQLWSATVPGPSGVTLDYTLQKAFVGGSDGKLRQLDLAAGTIDKTLTVTTVAPTDLGMPTLDTTASRLHVGTMDGRICAFPDPLP